MQNLKILLVDDEVSILLAITREIALFLEEKKITLLSTTSGEKALDILKQEASEVAIIISDQRMPGMSGSSLLLKVKELYPDIVSIILTAHAELEEIIKDIKAGVFSFIVKPWDRRYLLAEIERAFQVYTLRKDNKRYLKIITEELKWGGELQRTLLRREIPKSDSVTFSITYLPMPSLHCSGDYYDIIFLEEGLYLVLIGDVAGHGIKGALVTAILKSIIYTGYVSRHRNAMFSPAAFLCWLNRQVCNELKHLPDTIITFAACFIDLNQKKICYAKAGHLPMVLVRDGRVLNIDAEGSGMGFTTDLEYRNTVITLQSQDVLYLFTDGLVERNSRSTESNFLDWGTLFIATPPEVDRNAEILMRSQQTFEDEIFTDDVTLISIQINK